METSVLCNLQEERVVNIEQNTQDIIFVVSENFYASASLLRYYVEY